MLSEERYNKILQFINKNKTVSVAELVEALGASESTIRRDLNLLALKNKIIKVHGGATVVSDNFDFSEQPVETKKKMFSKEKDIIAEYAETIRDNDFVFIDAGTTTEKMIEYISPTNATFVTNGFTHAKKLARKNLKVYIVGGQVKTSTEAIVGTRCIEGLRSFNFTKCYVGTNGISLSSGFTTPDPDEAIVKQTVIERSYVSYILADHSKFNQVSSVTFSTIDKACIITDYLPDKKFLDKCTIKEVIE